MRLANPNIQKLGFYKPPLDGRRNYPGVLLDFNERTASISPKVKAALQAFVQEGKFCMYPEYGDLEARIASYVGVKPEQVSTTNGGDQGLELVFRTYTDKGDTVIIPAPSFTPFFQFAEVVGNTIVKPLYRWEEGMKYPMKDVLEAIDSKTRLILVCSPNNPTGTTVSLEEIETLLKAAPNAIVLVDEVYTEFSGQTACPLIDKYPNLILVHSFSKVFAMGGLRLGYLLAQEDTLKEMLKVRGPYDVNMAAVVAAEAALNDLEDVDNYVREVMTVAKPMVENFFDSRKIEYIPSQSNFILFKPKNAESLFEKLSEGGVRVRLQKGNGIDGTLRVTIGTQEQTKTFLDLLTTLL